MDYFERLCNKVINDERLQVKFEEDNKLLVIESDYITDACKEHCADILKVYQTGEKLNKDTSTRIEMQYNLYFDKEKSHDGKYVLADITIIVYYENDHLYYLPVIHSYYYFNHEGLDKSDPDYDTYSDNYSLNFQENFDNLPSCIKNLIDHFSNYDKNAYPHLDKFIELASEYFEI